MRRLQRKTLGEAGPNGDGVSISYDSASRPATTYIKVGAYGILYSPESFHRSLPLPFLSVCVR
jgi:hypothetical protein